MTKSAPGHKGATRATWSDYNPRVLVKRVMDRHPTAGVDEVRRRVAEALQGDDSDYLEAFIHYAVDNAFEAIVRAENVGRTKPRVVAGTAIATATASAAASASSPEQTEAARSARVQDRIKAVTRVLILSLLSPDGKRAYGELPIGDFIKLGERQRAFGRKLLRDGHKVTELLVNATTNEALDTALNGVKVSG